MQQARLAVGWACNRVIILLEASASWRLEVQYDKNDKYKRVWVLKDIKCIWNRFRDLGAEWSVFSLLQKNWERFL
jgi:hypothetical protein